MVRGTFALRWPSEAALLRIASALLLPPVALGGWLGARRGSLDGLLASAAVRLWGAALLLALFAGVIAAARARGHVRSLAWAAALAAFLSLTVAVGSRYSGTLELGEGEPPGRWTTLSAGPFANLPVVEVVELPGDAKGRVRLRVRGREEEGRPAEEVAAGADRLVVTRVAPALAFELRRQGGEPLDGLLVKLHPGEVNEFGFERMPHRVMAPLEATSEIAIPTPAVLRLRVHRGKLSVADETVRLGDAVRFEGLALACGDGARWARLEARGGWPAGYWLAAALGLLASAAAGLDRRRAGA